MNTDLLISCSISDPHHKRFKLLWAKATSPTGRVNLVPCTANQAIDFVQWANLTPLCFILVVEFSLSIHVQRRVYFRLMSENNANRVCFADGTVPKRALTPHKLAKSSDSQSLITS